VPNVWASVWAPTAPLANVSVSLRAPSVSDVERREDVVERVAELAADCGTRVLISFSDANTAEVSISGLIVEMLATLCSRSPALLTASRAPSARR
jgi:hypothetical protein